MIKLNIGYFADGPWSHKAFEMLVNDDGISISFICARFDTQDKTLEDYCGKYNIAYLKHQDINTQEFITTIKKYRCDLLVSMSFNQIFKAEIIQLPPLGVINCHAGKLPFYRGRNILNWALINDEKEFGITVHFIDQGIDTGDIILQRTFAIDDDDDYSTLLNTSYNECANILYDAINHFKDNRVNRLKQSDIHQIGFYCSQRKEGDETLNWNQDSRSIFNFTRSICAPGPRARAFINNKEMKINKIIFLKDAPKYHCIIGAVLDKNATGFLVKTKDSFVKVVEFEYQGNFRVGDRFEIK